MAFHIFRWQGRVGVCLPYVLTRREKASVLENIGGVLPFFHISDKIFGGSEEICRDGEKYDLTWHDPYVTASGRRPDRYVAC